MSNPYLGAGAFWPVLRDVGWHDNCVSVFIVNDISS